jgi:hypothetical protein
MLPLVRGWELAVRGFLMDRHHIDKHHHPSPGPQPSTGTQRTTFTADTSTRASVWESEGCLHGKTRIHSHRHHAQPPARPSRPIEREGRTVHPRESTVRRVHRRRASSTTIAHQHARWPPPLRTTIFSPTQRASARTAHVFVSLLHQHRRVCIVARRTRCSSARARASEA